MHLSHADHRSSPPRVEIPRDYNAAHDLLSRNAMRADKVAYIDTWLWDKSGQFQLDTLTEGQD